MGPPLTPSNLKLDQSTLTTTHNLHAKHLTPNLTYMLSMQPEASNVTNHARKYLQGHGAVTLFVNLNLKDYINWTFNSYNARTAWGAWSFTMT